MAVSKKWNKLLIASNLLLLAIVLLLIWHGGYLQKTFRSLTEKQRAYTYADNHLYPQQTSLYPLYEEQRSIVIIGDSYVSNVSWTELLGRCDIAARGISNDISSGLLHRLDAVTSLQPAICFVQGGLNDVSMGIPAKEIAANFKNMVERLLAHEIIPVLHTVNPVAGTVPEAVQLNKNIQALNQKIKVLAREKNIACIDLDSLLSDGNFLRPEYAQKDGVHLNSAAYRVWREKIKEILAATPLQVSGTKAASS